MECNTRLAITILNSIGMHGRLLSTDGYDHFWTISYGHHQTWLGQGISCDFLIIRMSPTTELFKICTISDVPLTIGLKPFRLFEMLAEYPGIAAKLSRPA